jgi:dolichol-phosphate mannosyltransferase
MEKERAIILETESEAPVREKTISEIVNNGINVEIILVDDDSSDGTLEKVKNINNPNIKIFSRKFRGLASAFLLGLINSSGDIVGWIDSNLKSAAIKLPEMLNHLNNNDIVLLSRYIKGGKDERRKFRIFASKIVNWLCQLILSKEIKDYTSGMFVMKRNVLITITPICYGHGEFFIEFIYRAHKRGLKIFEIPFVQPPDLEKMSKTASNIFRFFSFGFYYLIAIFHSLTRRN